MKKKTMLKLRELEIRVKQLECPHKNVRFDVYREYVEVCEDCDKILNRFYSEKEWLETKLVHEKIKCRDNIAETDARIRQLKEA